MTVEYWCWLPSLSGRVFEESNDFEGKLCNASSPFRFEVASSSDLLARIIAKGGADQSISAGPGPKDVIIDVLDEGGLCRISSQSAGFHELASAWSAFRVALDGCSRTKFNCSSMNLPVGIAAGADPFDALARKMLESVETITDAIAYLAGDSFEWTEAEEPTGLLRAECDANVLYFGAFMDLYRDRFDKSDRKRMIREMERRAGKLDMACRYVDGREVHWFNRTTVILSRTALIISIIAILISIVVRRSRTISMSSNTDDRVRSTSEGRS